jgi:hypothetical protein
LIAFYGPELHEVAASVSDYQVQVKTELVTATDIRRDDFVCNPESRDWLQLYNVDPTVSPGMITFYYEKDRDNRAG